MVAFTAQSEAVHLKQCVRCTLRECVRSYIQCLVFYSTEKAVYAIFQYLLAC